MAMRICPICKNKNGNTVKDGKCKCALCGTEFDPQANDKGTSGPAGNAAKDAAAGTKEELEKEYAALAKEYGADAVVNTKTQSLEDFTNEFTEGRGFDVCIEACGAPETFLNCIDCAAFAANIILIGNGKRETSFVHSIILKKELNIHGSRNALNADFINNIRIVADKKADVMKMVSGVYDMENALDAFKALADNDGTLAKLLIKIGD